MKKIYLPAIAAALCAIPVQATALSGTCGENATWTLENNTLHISGTGATTDYVSPGSIYATFPEWYDYRDDIHHIIIDEGITTIGDFSFYQYKNLESVSIPEGVTYIGSYTFGSCVALKGVTLPSTVESLGTPMINYSTNGGTFSNCQSLTEITLPEGLKIISGATFNECTNLEKVTWNAIDCAADVTDPVARYTGIFAQSGVSSVTFGPKVASIPAEAFRDVGQLHTINTSGNVEFVGEKAFYGTSWEINQDFEKLIYVDHAAYLFKWSDDDYIHTDTIDVTILPGTTCITNNAFQGFKRIKSVTIPETVRFIGDNAFNGCDALKRVEWNPVETSGLEGYTGKHIFSKVYNQVPLEEIIFGDKVAMIPDYLLSECGLLTEINLPESLVSIGESAFEQCVGITTLTVPDKVETIGKNFTYQCTNLEKVTIGEGLKTFSYTYFLAGSPKLTTLEWNAIRTDTKTLDLYHLSDACSAPVETLILGDKVEYMPGQLFLNSTSLAKVVFGNSVEEIGEGAFRGCKQLTSVTLPASLKLIDSNAFYNSGIEHLIIPENVTTIDTWALKGDFTQIVFTPLEAPDASGALDYDTRLYVADYNAYYDAFSSYRPQIEPMANADRVSFAQDEINLPVKFTCNIPGYTMAVTDMPALDSEPGDHTAIVEATFTGEQDFTAKFAYRYNVTPSSGISEVASPTIDIATDVYTIDGRLLYRNMNTDRLTAIPSGIYILKNASGTVKKVIR